MVLYKRMVVSMKKQIHNLQERLCYFYVDDLNTGVYSTEEGFDSIRKLKFDFWKLILMLQSGGRMTKI